MQDDHSDEVLARVQASVGRRFLGIGMLCFLAVMVLYVAASSSPSFGWRMFLVALGAGSLMIANVMRKSTSQTLELTRQELRDSDGVLLAKLDDVVSIDRGAFAFKPSNGFLLRLSAPYDRAWRPGLWWRGGNRVGVGGMTPGRQTKYMSEIIAVIIAERDGQV